MTRMLRERHDAGLEIGLGLGRVFFETRTPFQEVLIADTEAFGRGLFLDRSPQSFASDEGVYHAALVQPAMFTHPNPRRVLVAGGGEGATLREVLRHRSVERAVMVDIDEALVRACEEHLPRWSQGAFKDPRAQLVFQDVRVYLRDCPPASFDVIVLDLGDPLEDSPSQLCFTREFYAMVERALAPGGVVVTQACELDLAATHDFRAVRSTLATALPHTVPYGQLVPSFFAYWGFVMAGRAPLPLTPPDHEARWRATGGDSWKHYEPAGHAPLLYLSPSLRKRLEKPGVIATDDKPLAVYDDDELPLDELDDVQ